MARLLSPLVTKTPRPFPSTVAANAMSPCGVEARIAHQVREARRECRAFCRRQRRGVLDPHQRLQRALPVAEDAQRRALRHVALEDHVSGVVQLGWEERRAAEEAARGLWNRVADQDGLGGAGGRIPDQGFARRRAVDARTEGDGARGVDRRCGGRDLVGAAGRCRAWRGAPQRDQRREGPCHGVGTQDHLGAAAVDLREEDDLAIRRQAGRRNARALVRSQGQRRDLGDGRRGAADGLARESDQERRAGVDHDHSRAARVAEARVDRVVEKEAAGEGHVPRVVERDHIVERVERVGRERRRELVDCCAVAHQER